MAGTAIPGRLGWQLARLVGKQVETPRVATLHLASDDWPGHLPGQHVDVRVTAEDGYQAQRSYSIASPQEDPPSCTMAGIFISLPHGVKVVNNDCSV